MSRKKEKFVPISKFQSNNYVMPGRIKCDCAGAKHELINNCTSCGRIVCEQEGAGLCWFCGDIVSTNKDLEKIRNNSGKGQALLQQLQKLRWPHQDEGSISNINNVEINNDNTALMKAEESKNRLLEFDKTNARTKVIDDQMDYYNVDKNVWISPKQKEAMQKKEESLRKKRFAAESQKNTSFTLDLSSGQLIEEKENEFEQYKELFEDPQQFLEDIKEQNLQCETNIDTGFLQFIPEQLETKGSTGTEDKEMKLRRIQGSELSSMRDDGMCLSMHQPWASLLVKGIKKHEGRSWYSNHRGCLWIAAAAKEPSQEDIYNCKEFYQSRGVSSAAFPKSYPVGCILGCVEVVDCLPQEDYIESFPDGEEPGSLFIFVCQNPHELKIKFPIKGKHKIYKLESHIHQAAKCGLE